MKKSTLVILVLSVELMLVVLMFLGLILVKKDNANLKNEATLIEERYINVVADLKNEITALKNEMNEIKSDLILAESKNKEYENQIQRMSTAKYIQQFQFPVDEDYRNKITSNQGLRDPLELANAGGTTSGKYHNAIDIAVPDFTPVYAAKSGKIVEVYPSYYNGGAKYNGHPVYGGYIEIEHDDGTFSTIYAHLSMTSVHEGDLVETGDKIGYSGGVAGRRGSGQSTGPHLHFEIIVNINDCFEENFI